MAPTSPHSRREFLRRAASVGLLVGASGRWLASAPDSTTIRGVVRGAGAPLEGVRVSDGRRVVKTDASGRYSIDVGPDSGPFLFVTTPPGYWKDLFYVPTVEAVFEGEVDFSLDSRSQSDAFQFVFWTDMHLDGGGVALRKFRRTVEEVRALQPAFVWGQGDITLQGKAGSQYVEALSELGIPVRNGAGNHEMLVDSDRPRSEFETLFGPTYYSFDWAGIHCVVLDGNRVVSQEDHWSSVEGCLSERELAWLEADLRAKPRGVPVIVGIHIPLVSTYSARRAVPPETATPWNVSNADRVHELLRKLDGRLVLQGHLHENERIRIDGVEYASTQAVSGSWWKSGEGFERGVDAAPRGYRVVEVQGSRITHAFRASAESYTGTVGELEGRSANVSQRRDAWIVLNAYDAPNDAKARGRLGEGTWVEMPPHPAVHAGLRMIQPHHYLLEVDTTKVEPGRHAVRVDVLDGDRVERFRGEISVLDSAKRRVPLIYCTDLFHPHVDPDDHFDLATIFALPEVDLRAVILDDGPKQQKEPGTVAVRQLEAITGRRVPVATGLAPRLESPRDPAKGQPRELQGGVELILKVLRESSEPVTIVAVGSLRDVAAAYNRAPALVAQKVDRLFVFIGDAYSQTGFEFREYNVTLDVNAYRAVLESGLQVFWVPCFDGGGRKNGDRASYWKASHRDLLADVVDPVKQYFIYALLRKSETDPVAFLRRPVDPAEWEQVLSMDRNLWCCAVFTALADRKILRRGESWTSVMPGEEPGEGSLEYPFSFERVLVRIDETGMALYPDELPRYAVERFRVTDPVHYPHAMTELTAEILRTLGTS